MRNFINLKDIPAKDLRKILNDAKKRKNKRDKLKTLDTDKDIPLKGKLLVQMYEKESSRTRLSFHIAIKQLGADSITVKASELHLGKGGESLADTAKILSTYCDGFLLRTDSDKKIEDFKRYLTIPIINLLSPSSHPCQVLSDVFTVEEIKKDLIDFLHYDLLANSVLDPMKFSHPIPKELENELLDAIKNSIKNDMIQRGMSLEQIAEEIMGWIFGDMSVPEKFREAEYTKEIKRRYVVALIELGGL